MHQVSTQQPNYLSQSRTSIQVQELVLSIEHTDEPAFHITFDDSSREQIKPTCLSALLMNAQQLIELCSHCEQYDYSEHLKVFGRACQDINLALGPAGPVCLDSSGSRYLSFYQSMNVLVDHIRQLTRSIGYQRKASDRLYQARQKAIALEGYVRAVLKRYSRTVVVRVDLHYLDSADPLLRIEHLCTDLKALIRAREHNPIFEHETGYIWSVEQGKDRGFHIHAAFFFNGAHVRSDWHKADQIGKLWEKISAGRGYCYNCNADKGKYATLGIGTINRSDGQVCNIVIKAMCYLAKQGQHLHIKPKGARTFGTGQLT
ncbi:Protein of unknown function (DUF3296) [Pseudomonas sp. GM21]|uniref:YagK/YfjJ domain-containing protein n=1 Tax=Pseudomonas sp. GM21 TaxID=1144325 RepID=UPI0002724E08|nr:inovirus-type Gp2 protein [Pseudomonas sp. GM21]EJM13779.1 Protein of unknown function (DUF3296) [Pseudomonas sp. GM21]